MTPAIIAYIEFWRVIMTLSALNVLSGIAAAATGLAGEKVSKDGVIPGLDLAAIIPAMLGKSGGIAGIAGSALASVAKAGLLNTSKLGNIAELAGSLLSFGKADTAKKATGGITGLAQAIMGNTGAGSLASIATMASGLAKSAKNEKEVGGMASDLGKTLASSFGVSLGGGGTALKALDKVMGNDTKGDLFKAILKGLS
jgi:hypothetical protein